MREKLQEWVARLRLVPESALFLASGMCALGGVLLAGDSHARIAAAVAVVPMVGLLSLQRTQSRQLVELQNQLSNSKEEVFTRRSTMRFIFDELLPNAENLSPQVRHVQQQLEKALASAGGLAELLGQNLEDPPHSVRQKHLHELKQSLKKCASLNRQYARPGGGRGRPAAGVKRTAGEQRLMKGQAG